MDVWEGDKKVLMWIRSEHEIWGRRNVLPHHHISIICSRPSSQCTIWLSIVLHIINANVPCHSFDGYIRLHFTQASHSLRCNRLAFLLLFSLIHFKKHFHCWFFYGAFFRLCRWGQRRIARSSFIRNLHEKESRVIGTNGAADTILGSESFLRCQFQDEKLIGNENSQEFSFINFASFFEITIHRKHLACTKKLILSFRLKLRSKNMKNSLKIVDEI